MTQCDQVIKVIVDYYSESHKKALSQYPYSKAAVDKLSELVDQSQVAIPISEFMANTMFRDLNTGPPHLANLQAILKSVEPFSKRFEDYFTLTDSSLKVKPQHEPPNELREMIGVGIGLSVINLVHGMTTADWTKIPVKDHKAMDFEHRFGSDGSQMVEVENKGSVVSNNQMKPPTISVHANRILGKKKSLRNDDLYQKSKKPPVRYGTIASIDAKNTLRCWVLDPPTLTVESDPYNAKVLLRLRFWSHILQIVSPYSLLTKKLLERVKSMEMEGITAFDGVPLDIPQGLVPNPSLDATDRGSFFRGIRGKAITQKPNAGGILGRLENSRAATPQYLFLGLRLDVMELVFNQKHEDIAAYYAQSVSIDSTIESQAIDNRRRSKAIIQQSSSGLVFSIFSDSTPQLLGSTDS